MKNKKEIYLKKKFRRITGKVFFRTWLNIGGNFRLKYIRRKFRSDGAVAFYIPLIYWGAIRRRKHRILYNHGNFGNVLVFNLFKYQFDNCDILFIYNFRPDIIIVGWIKFLLPFNNNPKYCIFRKTGNNIFGINNPKTFRSQKQNIRKPGIGLGGAIC